MELSRVMFILIQAVGIINNTVTVSVIVTKMDKIGPVTV